MKGTKHRERKNKNKKQITNQQKLIDCCNRLFAANVNSFFYIHFILVRFVAVSVENYFSRTVTMVYAHIMIIIIIICIQDKK